ncbi:MAG: hypothetical protein A2571_03015 [Candidatus Vogelbacteria bacterium RIFOXYD1_FULL_44_32]|uniref:Type II secretion system protein GspI C-terminal domain-containing protein n=1 Tax=Candidatus Vogelbacteria bacterium RIFOXYD1_FULL_44_32 TaxID=1802438 RepID=A0A1G2QCJ5_9BACT|nr:MAG: hypothetical protein A2571_03015 [Candidatus Vogelbacteria bacterium RIFOXYD1_FULL_44_32]
MIGPNKNKQGFTLIETFVAVLILVFAVIAPLGLLARAISDGNFAKNQVIAYFLAQEGIELVINKRDNNIAPSGEGEIDPNSWLNDMAPCSANGCNPTLELEFRACSNTDMEAVDYGGRGNCQLYLTGNEDANTYSVGNFNTDTPSLFSRQVKISDIVGKPGQRLVTSKVIWSEKNKINKTEISTIIQNLLSPPPSAVEVEF